MPTNNLAEFLIYIVPGFIAVQIFHWRYPVRERNSFLEITYSFTSGIFIISFLKWIDSYFFSHFLLSDSNEMPGVKFTIAIFLFGIIFGFASISQRELRNYLSKKFIRLRWLSSGTDAIWESVNSPEKKDWAMVFLVDGSIYLGWIANYSYDPNNNDQDFLLSNASRYYENLVLMYQVVGAGIYLNTRDVKRIEFRKYDHNNPILKNSHC